jgi:hypothetical protein
MTMINLPPRAKQIAWLVSIAASTIELTLRLCPAKPQQGQKVRSWS